MSSLQASRFASAVCAATGGGASEYVPITATPTEPVLKPSAWAPITFFSTPPNRPSKTWPYRSTRKL
jgi:hypothetical protein